MEKEELKTIIADQNEKLHKKNTIKREIQKNLEKPSKLITIISGIRRSGKSTLLDNIKQKSNNTLYINFDDFRLIEFSLKDFSTINEIIIEKNIEELYFDEIQNIPYWERFIRTMHDNNKKIFITGSNASMLSSELGTHLTGRNKIINLYPFSFREYLKFKNYKINNIEKTKTKLELKNLFNQYLDTGGFPEYIINKEDYYLQIIYEDIINRDIIARHNINNTRALKELLYYLFSNIGKTFSYNKIKDLINVKNSTTVKEYIEYFENSYLLFTINKYDYSLKKQLMSKRKVYSIDTGLANKISFKFSKDKGRILENFVAIELKRREHEIYYHFKNKECDFIIKQKEKITQAIQVTQTLEDPQTKKRELEGLLDAMESYNLKTGLILTEDEEGEETINNKTIIIKPIWKWCIEDNNINS